MACESWKASNGSMVAAAATSPLWLQSGKVANTGRNYIIFHAGTMERNTNFPQKIPVYSWAVWGEKRRGAVEPFLADRAGLGPGFRVGQESASG